MSTESFDPTKTTDTTAAAEGTTTPAAAAPSAQILDGKIVIGDRIYDADALAKKLENADKHIAKLEEENATHVEQGTTLLDRLEKLEQSVKTGDALEDLTTALKNQDNDPESSTKTPAASTEELTQTITQTVRDSLKAEELEARQTKNFNHAVLKAKEAYGEEFGNKVDEIGLANDMQPEAVIELAKNNPKAWEKLFLPAETQKKPDTTGSTIIPGQQQGGEGRSTGYLKMRSSKDQRAEFQRRMAEAEAKYK